MIFNFSLKGMIKLRLSKTKLARSIFSTAVVLQMIGGINLPEVHAVEIQLEKVATVKDVDSLNVMKSVAYDSVSTASNLGITSVEVVQPVVINEEAEEFELSTKDEKNYLLEISNPDESYEGKAVDVGSERDLLERIVMGEAGGESFEGAALVAQCIHDTMVYEGYSSVRSVIDGKKYSGSLEVEPSEMVKEAVSYIFDDGGMAVQHKVIYFYAPKIVDSGFHESRELVIEYGGHRFFY